MYPFVASSKSVRYIVNEKERTCVCLLQVNPEITGHIIDKYLLASSLDPCTGIDLNLCTTFKGIAKCHPKDEWDPKIGTELARDRAEKQMRAVINDHLKQYAKNLRHAADLIEKYGVK